MVEGFYFFCKGSLLLWAIYLIFNVFDKIFGYEKTTIDKLPIFKRISRFLNWIWILGWNLILWFLTMDFLGTNFTFFVAGFAGFIVSILWIVAFSEFTFAWFLY